MYNGYALAQQEDGSLVHWDMPMMPGGSSIPQQQQQHMVYAQQQLTLPMYATQQQQHSFDGYYYADAPNVAHANLVWAGRQQHHNMNANNMII